VSLLLYAVCAKRPRALAGKRGTLGEPLSAIACGDLVAVVGKVASTPPLDASTLRAHEAVVRALAKSVDAILPARFGTLVPDAARVATLVAERREALEDALALVAGREQMTLRVFGAAHDRALPPPARAVTRGGVGTRYLAARRADDRRARALPEIDWLRPAIKRFVRAERVERHRTPPLVASVHHLIPRGRAADYLAAVARAERRASRNESAARSQKKRSETSHARARGVRVVASGPWPPWAFAADDVA
jgi:gas vesicle protein GvpL/GvpF